MSTVFLGLTSPTFLEENHKDDNGNVVDTAYIKAICPCLAQDAELVLWACFSASDPRGISTMRDFGRACPKIKTVTGCSGLLWEYPPLPFYWCEGGWVSIDAR